MTCLKKSTVRPRQSCRHQYTNLISWIAKEKLIGWYHSGPKLRSSDLEINELFKRYTPNPVLVIVDVKPNDAEIPTDAYFAIEEIKDVC